MLSAVCVKHPPRACACCCCALSTDNVEKGNVTKEQASCACCKGTGVCSVSCELCRDNDKDDDDDDCEATYCCGIVGRSRVNKLGDDNGDEMGEYQLLDGGCSCVCPCAKCEKGQCCGGLKCSNSHDCAASRRKSTAVATMAVYQGVPIQVV
jgi:hypothetical protein